MDADSRDWGRPSLVDYVPFLGAVYRFYWWRVAAAEEGERWRDAGCSELRRATVPVSASAAAVVLVSGVEDAAGYAVLAALTGLLVYRAVELTSAGGRR